MSHRGTGLSQGGLAYAREARLLTGRLGLSQGGWASHREVGPLTRRLGLSQGGQASHRVLTTCQNYKKINIFIKYLSINFE